VAVADYARFNQEILGNESVISYDASIPYEKDMGTEPEVLATLGQQFEVVAHHGNPQTAVDQTQCDVAYFLRSGDRGFVADNCRTVVHAVFQLYDPHADRYAYISEWLAGTMNQRHGGQVPYVPHMVNLPEPTMNIRESLGISPDVTLIGRMGGYNTFNIPFVKQAIVDLLNERDDYMFIMIGTAPWIEHPRVKYFREFNDLQLKANFISACDAMLHARSNGESFGLTIVEALAMNKPVLAWEGGEDQNHSLLLAGSGLLYNQHNILDKLRNIRDFKSAETWLDRAAKFRPEPVMHKFNEVFLA
jgi:hypothetical protein